MQQYVYASVTYLALKVIGLIQAILKRSGPQGVALNLNEKCTTQYSENAHCKMHTHRYVHTKLLMIHLMS